jgi:predicted 3-demethylubiquinone-9 3-methyltransferase (glyoxalase superfamily)
VQTIRTQKISPYLWFDSQAEEAATLYASAFAGSRMTDVTRYGDAGPGPAGSVMIAAFELAGQRFFALNGGPLYKFTPAISFSVHCDTRQEIDELWQKLSAGGKVLMELDKYPFSERYGWLEDRFGVSWQLILQSHTQKITPSFLFVGQQGGKAEEAMRLYVSLFENSRILEISRHASGSGEPAGTVAHAVFTLNGQEFVAMDSSLGHAFTFTEAISLYVDCRTQPEVDDLWAKLSAHGEPGQCGWLKDRYGVSWQIIPSALTTLLSDPDPEKSQRVMKAMLEMGKIDIAGLERASKQP